jgi:lysophospholipase L1-like esterase
MRWVPSALFRRARQPRRLPSFRNNYRPCLEALETRLAPAGTLDLSGGFATASGLVSVNGSARLSGALLELTDGGGNEAGSAFSTTPVGISQFTTLFHFRLRNPNADGFTFTIQGNSPTALGPNGGGLGYGPMQTGGQGGIPKSVAIKFDLYNNQGEGGDSTGLYINGAAPTNVGSINLGSSGIDLHSGHAFCVGIAYDGHTLKFALTDTATNVTFTLAYTVDIPSIVGGTSAYVGFTAGTGGLTATQIILDWTYTPALVAPPAPANLTAVAGPGQVFLRWTGSPGAASYNVYRSTGGSPVLVQSGITDPFFVDTGLSSASTYSYQVTSVGIGGESAPSAMASATPVAPNIDFSAGFSNTGGLANANGSAKFNGSVLQLTDGRGNEAGSAFFSNAVGVTQFATQFDMQLINANADGLTFTIEGVSPTALGPNGGGLGYGPMLAGGQGGIPRSVAVKFDLYNNQGEGGDSTGLYVNGAAPTNAGSIDLSSSINLHSGHIFHVAMTYNGATLQVSITDTATKVTATQSYAVDIPTLVGASSAYVGFTAGTGGLTATQNILDWSYTSLSGDAFGLSHPAVSSATTPAPRDATWLGRHATYVGMAATGNTSVLFLGDSITDFWGGQGHDPSCAGTAIFQQQFAPLGATNFGISGDQTQNVLWRIENGELDGIHPKVVMLLIGTNNLGSNTPDQIAGGITAIVEQIQKQLPQTKVLLLGIFPRGQYPNPLRDKIKQVNAIISRLDDGGKTVKYLDIGSKFLQPDGTISSTIMPDFLHPSAAGYQIWADAVKDPINELLAAP